MKFPALIGVASLLMLFLAAAAQQAPPTPAGPAPASPGPVTYESINDPQCLHAGLSGTCNLLQGNFSGPLQPNGFGHRILFSPQVHTWGPSTNFGNMGGWTVTSVIGSPQVTFGNSGIDQYEGAGIVKNATGDLGGLYLYVYGGGRAALSDEGVTGITVQSGEIAGYFHGTVARGAGPGSTALQLAVNPAAKPGWGATCNGCMLLDISKGEIAGRLNGRSQPFGKTYLNQLPTTAVTVHGVAGRLPLTTAWCTTVAALPWSNVAGQGTTRTVDCTLGAIGGQTPAFRAGDVVAIAGPQYPEEVRLTGVEAPRNGLQRLTLEVRNPHTAGSIVFQGGIAGQSLSFDANLAATGFRTSYYVFGSVDGVHLIYGSQIAGTISTHTLPRLTSEAEQIDSGFHLYPSAEVVANTAAPAAPLLEPNKVNWETGDTVENPRFQSFGGFGIFDNCTVFTPTDQDGALGCMNISMSGPAISGTYHPFYLSNNNPASLYRPGGGAVDPVPAMSFGGNFADLLKFQRGPMPAGQEYNAVIDIGNTALGDKTPFNLFALPGSRPAEAQVTYDPGTLLVGFPQGMITSRINTLSNCSGAVGQETACGFAASGSFSIPAGASSVRVTTGAVNAASQILITPDMSLDGRLNTTCSKDVTTALQPFGVSARVPGRSFTLSIAGKAGVHPNCYSFTIVN